MPTEDEPTPPPKPLLAGDLPPAPECPGCGRRPDPLTAICGCNDR